MFAFRFFAVAAVLPMLLAVGCTQENEYQPPPPPMVRVSKPKVQTVPIYHEETGTTKPYELVEIRARVEGFLQEIAFTSGENVKGPEGDEPGDLLFQIDPRPFQARLDRAKAALMVAEADFRAKDSAYQRSVPLAESGTINAQELLDYQAERDAAEANMAAAQAEIDEAQLDLNYATIRAPISGRVGDSEVDLGNLVGSGEATILTEIVRRNPIYVDFYIPGRMLQQFIQDHPEERADGKRESPPIEMRLEIDTKYRFQGEVYYADRNIDESTGTYRIRAIFDNDNLEIVEGASVRVRFPLRVAEDALLIPQRAVSADRAGSYVFLVDEEDIVHRRYVTLGERMSSWVIVTENLSRDDTVIIDGLQRAREDQPVQPEPIELPEFDDGIDLDGEAVASPTTVEPPENENAEFEQGMEDDTRAAEAEAAAGRTAPADPATEDGTGS